MLLRGGRPLLLLLFASLSFSTDDEALASLRGDQQRTPNPLVVFRASSVAALLAMLLVDPPRLVFSVNQEGISTDQIERIVKRYYEFPPYHDALDQIGPDEGGGDDDESSTSPDEDRETSRKMRDPDLPCSTTRPSTSTRSKKTPCPTTKPPCQAENTTPSCRARLPTTTLPCGGGDTSTTTPPCWGGDSTTSTTAVPPCRGVDGITTPTTTAVPPCRQSTSSAPLTEWDVTPHDMFATTSTSEIERPCSRNRAAAYVASTEPVERSAHRNNRATSAPPSESNIPVGDDEGQDDGLTRDELPTAPPTLQPRDKKTAPPNTTRLRPHRTQRTHTSVSSTENELRETALTTSGVKTKLEASQSTSTKTTITTQATTSRTATTSTETTSTMFTTSTETTFLSTTNSHDGNRATRTRKKRYIYKHSNATSTTESPSSTSTEPSQKTTRKKRYRYHHSNDTTETATSTLATTPSQKKKRRRRRTTTTTTARTNSTTGGGGSWLDPIKRAGGAVKDGAEKVGEVAKDGAVDVGEGTVEVGKDVGSGVEWAGKKLVGYSVKQSRAEDEEFDEGEFEIEDSDELFDESDIEGFNWRFFWRPWRVHSASRQSKLDELRFKKTFEPSQHPQTTPLSSTEMSEPSPELEYDGDDVEDEVTPDARADPADSVPESSNHPLKTLDKADGTPSESLKPTNHFRPTVSMLALEQKSSEFMATQRSLIPKTLSSATEAPTSGSETTASAQPSASSSAELFSPQANTSSTAARSGHLNNTMAVAPGESFEAISLTRSLWISLRDSFHDLKEQMGRIEKLLIDIVNSQSQTTILGYSELESATPMKLTGAAPEGGLLSDPSEDLASEDLAGPDLAGEKLVGFESNIHWESVVSESETLFKDFIPLTINPWNESEWVKVIRDSVAIGKEFGPLLQNNLSVKGAATSINPADSLSHFNERHAWLQTGLRHLQYLVDSGSSDNLCKWYRQPNSCVQSLSAKCRKDLIASWNGRKSEVFYSEDLGVGYVDLSSSPITALKTITQIYCSPFIKDVHTDTVLQEHTTVAHHIAASTDPNSRGHFKGRLSSDPLSDQQWHLEELKISKFWRRTAQSAAGIPAHVLIVDSGIDHEHEDLNLWINENELDGHALIDDDGNGAVDDIYGLNAYGLDGNVTDTDGHGTYLAGIVSASVNNELGVASVSALANSIPCRMMTSGLGALSNLLKCLAYAVRMNIEIVLLPFGTKQRLPVLTHVIQKVAESGTICVASTSGPVGRIEWPALYAFESKKYKVLPVTGLTATYDHLMSHAPPSEAGLNLVGAPGENIISLGQHSTYGSGSGNAPAAAIAAGLLSLMYHQISYDDIYRAMATRQSDGLIHVKDLPLSKY